MATPTPNTLKITLPNGNMILLEAEEHIQHLLLSGNISISDYLLMLKGSESGAQLATVSEEDIRKASLCVGETQEGVQLIDVSEAETKKVTNFSWAENTVHLLLDEYKKRKEKFDCGKMKKSNLWKEIAEVFQQHGYTLTASQIESKWKGLTKNYKKVHDNNGKTGRGTHRCPYQDELEELLEKDHRYHPVSVAGTNLEEEEDLGAAPSTSSSASVSPCETPKQSRKKRKRDELQDLIMYKMECQERRHKEKMDLLKSQFAEFKELMTSTVSQINKNKE